MGTNEGASELSGAEKVVEVVPCNQKIGPAKIPSARELELEAHAQRQAKLRRCGLELEAHAQRQAKLRRCGLVMLAVMAGALMLVGAVGSIKWENELTGVLYTNADHRYALAALNVSSGLIFCIALIGLYLPAQWGLKLNVIGCAWYLVGTLVIEVFEGDKIVWTESMADVVFWGAFPIVQIVCILAGSSRNPAFVGGGRRIWSMQMRKRIALSALVLTGVTFLVTAGCALPQAPVDISGALKLTMIASGVGFMSAVVVCVFVAWPVRSWKNKIL